LHDIASLQSAPTSPRKAATAPYFNSNGRPISPAVSGGSDYFARRGSLPVDSPHRQSPLMSDGNAMGLPEVTGWQPIPMSDLESNKPARSRSVSRKPMAT